MPSHPARKPVQSARPITYNENRQYRALIALQNHLYRRYQALSSRQIAEVSIYVDRSFVARQKRSA